MSSIPVKEVVRHVKPLLSCNELEARRRVLALYRDFYRSIPVAVFEHRLPRAPKYFREILKEEFIKNKDVKDIRVIDMLVIKGQQHLTEIKRQYKQRCHVMYMTKDTHLPIPNTFIGKFLRGND